ncbi:LCP family protein [Enterococcus sp. DIV0660C]|uniref:LCP family protein n=1 Tax=Enterococcus sp. DIV0660C TaxID=2230880 RepID=UPI001A8C4943|nr:LCP family protein [Enterococcus sp. DIV0660C]MBO0431239.1 LCP family protein [Enterococcus sp. DIV0660C]
MSRMDRHNKKNKGKSLKNHTDNLFARRQRKQDIQRESDQPIGQKQNNPSFSNDFDPSNNQLNRPFDEYNEYEQLNQQPTGKKKFFRKKKSSQQLPKGRKKRSWKKILLGLFILVLLYSGISFFAGKFMAEHDSSLANAPVETFNGVQSENGAKNILILGSDTRGEDAGRADTIMVLQLRGPAHKPKLVSFMRDSFVNIPGVGQNKINSAYAYGGAELVRQTLAENFGIECQYYAKVDFQSFEKVIDALFMFGVKLDAEKDLNLDGVDIKKGVQKMDGHVLLQYARFRMDEEGDFGRVRRQQQVMNAIFSQLKNPINLLRAPYAAGKAIGYTSTDVTATFLATHLLSIGRGATGIDRLSVPVEGSWDYGNSEYAGSVLVIDNQMNQAAITTFLNE